MHRRRVLLPLLAILLATLSLESRQSSFSNAARAQVRIPAPEDVLGFRPGDDRKLASWSKVVEYFQKLAAASDRLKFGEIGKTTMGAPFVYATISAPENLKRLDEFKEIQRQLADPRILGSPTNPALADRKAAQLIARGKTIIAITCGIHSTEVGSYLSSMLIAYRLASSDEPEIQEILKNTIILLVPSTNPDGVDIVNNWYQKTLGTPYEGTDPPELYHKYTGHDDNRDWYAFTQVETQLVVDKILNIWHPQIVHDIHQQGALGSRLFLPPYMQPVEPNVPKQIVEGYTELGNYMAKEMRAEGFKGITTNSTYDAWSPSRAYSHYHGGVRILSETASCKLATPITVKFEELNSREGYDPKKESANFGPLWRGGQWHIRDITHHMTTAAFLLLKHAAQNRVRWLQRFYEIEKEAVRPRKSGELIAFKIEQDNGWFDNWYQLLRALEHGGVDVAHTDRGIIVPLDQPYGGFARALLNPQKYPDQLDSSGRPIAPYDVTAHTLPLLMGVRVSTVSAPFTARRLKKVTIARSDWEIPRGRVGLYKSYVPSMDEGWTRWVFSQLPPGQSSTSVKDAELRSGNLRASYDTIIIPDQVRNAILNGHRAGTMPPEYTGGLGPEGVKALREFVEQGGKLICLNRASDFAIEQFKLPVRDVVEGLPRTDFYVPGSILRIELDTNDPIAKGMPRESIAWVENSPVFEVLAQSSRRSLNEVKGEGLPERQSLSAHRDGEAATQLGSSLTPGSPAGQPGWGGTVREGVSTAVRVIAWYPKNRDPLLSGWLLGGDRIKGKAALVEVTMGKGRIILFGFRPQYRGQSLATYPLFFNAITNH